MDAIIASFRRDHDEIETLLRILERECDLFRRAERPDYELLSAIVDHFRFFLDQWYQPKEDLLFNLTRTRTGICDDIIDEIADERAAAASNLEALGDALGNILNEQRVLRETFDGAARGFIQHERRQIEIEGRRLFPTISCVLVPTDWADLHLKLRELTERLRLRGLEERLRDQRHWIEREAEADRAERSRLTARQS